MKKLESVYQYLEKRGQLLVMRHYEVKDLKLDKENINGHIATSGT